MKRFIKVYMITLAMFAIVLCSTIIYYRGRIQALNESHRIALDNNTKFHTQKIAKLRTYKYLYEENNKDINNIEVKYRSLKNEYETFKNNIAYAKKNYSPSRGANTDLKTFSPITVDELNEWIQQKAPSNSPFIGNAKVFINASKETGLDPKYIVAHAALESGWGASKISKDKFNYFGIGAYNSSPYSSSHSFNSMEDGIVNGAKWIERNYINQGQNTLTKMIYGSKSYCVTDSGIPDDNWIMKISSIMQ